MSDATAAALAALNQTLKQTNEYIRECIAIVDELFPEAEERRKPRRDPDPAMQRQWGGEGR